MLRGDLGRAKATTMGMMGGMMTGIKTMLAGMGVMIGGMMVFQAGKVAATFQSTMIDARANARLLGEAGTEAFRMMEKEARRLGATTQFSAVQAAEAINQLVLGGLTATEATKSLTNVLNLAASANLGMGEAAKIVVDNMRKYNMEASETAKIGDFLSSAQSRAQITARDLAQGHLAVGASAATMGVSFQQVTAILTGMGRAGTEMSKAGTSIGMMLTRLSIGVPEVKRAMDEMGMSMEDFVTEDGFDLIAMLKKIAVSLPTGPVERMSAIGRLFGARGRAIAGVLSLMAEEGDFVSETFKGLGEDMGRAAKVATAKMDTIKGAFLELKSAIQEVAIAGLTPFLKAMIPVIDFLRDTAGVVSNISKAIEKMFIKAGESAWGPFLKSMVKLVALGTAVLGILITLGLIAKGLAITLGFAFSVALGPIGIFLGGLTAIGAAIILVAGKGDTFAAKMKNVFGKIPIFVRMVKLSFVKLQVYLRGLFVRISEGISSAFSGPLKGTRALLLQVQSWFVETFKAIVANMDVMLGSWEGFGRGFINIAYRVASSLKEVWEHVRHQFEIVWMRMVAFGQILWEGLLVWLEHPFVQRFVAVFGKLTSLLDTYMNFWLRLATLRFTGVAVQADSMWKAIRGEAPEGEEAASKAKIGAEMAMKAAMAVALSEGQKMLEALNTELDRRTRKQTLDEENRHQKALGNIKGEAAAEAAEWRKFMGNAPKLSNLLKGAWEEAKLDVANEKFFEKLPGWLAQGWNKVQGMLRGGVDGKPPPGAVPGEGDEDGRGGKKWWESRMGFADLGRSIQDELLKKETVVEVAAKVEIKELPIQSKLLMKIGEGIATLPSKLGVLVGGLVAGNN